LPEAFSARMIWATAPKHLVLCLCGQMLVSIWRQVYVAKCSEASALGVCGQMLRSIWLYVYVVNAPKHVALGGCGQVGRSICRWVKAFGARCRWLNDPKHLAIGVCGQMLRSILRKVYVVKWSEACGARWMWPNGIWRQVYAAKW
jgi:hypothetical protein